MSDELKLGEPGNHKFPMGPTVNKEPIKLKKFYGFGDDIPIYFRPGTSDEAIIEAILIKKTDYIFPTMADAEMCFDIGANIGIVSVLLTHLYPEAIIHAFEPEEDNFNLLFMNTEKYPNILIHNYGLGASNGKKSLWPSDDPINKGGFSNFIQHGEPIDVQIYSIRQVCAQLGTPNIIKIDVEGAECEILRNMPDIKNVRWITGELHGEDAEYMLLQRLSSSFKLAHTRNFDDKVWHFNAVNKVWLQHVRNAAAPPEK